MFSSTPWFSNEGWVKFGRWVLFPSNIVVSKQRYKNQNSQTLLLTRWNLEWLSLPTSIRTSLTALTWHLLLQNLIRYVLFNSRQVLTFFLLVFANQKGLFLSMTVPAVCVLMVVIVSLILAFSLAHWFAYHDTVNRDKLFQERYQQI